MSSNLPWMWFAMRASGITAWTLLSATIMWGLLLRTRILPAGSPIRLMSMHKYLGSLALVTLAVHLATVLLDPTMNFTWANALIPFTSSWKPFALGLGIIAAYLMVPVQLIARVRARMGKVGVTWFNRTHLIAYAAWPLATAHYVMAGTDALVPASLMLIGSVTLIIVLLLTARGWLPRGYFAKRATAQATSQATSTRAERELIGAGSAK
ncbi:MAG: Vanillate O-demethylase oxidoreductase [Actinomycetota bacterium]|jgi:predicted ferric reductase